MSLNLDFSFTEDELTIEDIIDDKIQSNQVKSIAKRMAIKIKDDENAETTVNNLDYLLKIKLRNYHS